MKVIVLLLVSGCIVSTSAQVIPKDNGYTPYCDAGRLNGYDLNPKKWGKAQKDTSWNDPKDKDQSLLIYEDDIVLRKAGAGPAHPKGVCYINSGNNIVTSVSLKSTGGCAGESTLRQTGPNVVKWTMRGTAGKGHGFQYHVVIKGHKGKNVNQSPFMCCTPV